MAYAVMLLEDEDAPAGAGQQHAEAEARGPGTDNDHRCTGYRLPLEFGWGHIIKRRILISCHHSCPFCS